MNTPHRHLSRILIAAMLLIGLLVVTWHIAARPTAAQSTEPPHSSDLLRDPLRLPGPTLASAHRIIAQPQAIKQVTGSNPGPWTRVAFASGRDSNWEIYTANGDGSATTRLTFNPAADTTPNLNRGGTRIIFISNRDGNGEVYVMNADGSGQTRLTNTPATEYWPSWSPDGSKIVYQVNNDSSAEIYVMNADGSHQTRLTNNAAWDGNPAWSPDGTQIVFSSNRQGTYDIWKMNANGTNAVCLTNGAANAYYPDWSPDGSTIIFNYDANGDSFYDIATVSANGGAHTPLSIAPLGIDEIAPKWDPSGKYYAYTRLSWVYNQNHWSLTSANARAQQVAGADTWLIGNSDADWWPDWQTTDLSAPTSLVAALPSYSPASFNVSWSGADVGLAGLATYDVQYRDGAAGAWTDWLTNTIQISATFTGLDGHTYYFQSRARDYANNLEAYPGGNGDSATLVDVTPPTSSVTSPLYAATPQFLVNWSGSDASSGLSTYDLQYRDGANGVWTNWLTSTTQTSALYNGQLGHTYFFQSRARDKAGNLEAYPGGNGDTLTHTPLFALSGRIQGNRAQPIALAQAQSLPASLNAASSDYLGAFHLYYNLSGTVAITAARPGFGPLPAMAGLVVSETAAQPIFYLPPLDNLLADSHFETGDLLAWHPSGALTPTITTTAHTGRYAVRLGGTVLSDTLTTAPWRSTLAQTIDISPTLVQGTLALLYRVAAAEPLSDTLTAHVVGANESLTFTLPLTVTGWTQQWFDLSAWTAPTATLQLELATPDRERPVGVLVDEVTWGSALIGSYPVFLPIARR